MGICSQAASGGSSLPVVGDGSAQLLGGVDEVGDGDPLHVVHVLGAVDLRVDQVLLHAVDEYSEWTSFNVLT